MAQQKKLWINWAVFVLTGFLYFLLKIPYHELWKDEWQPWLLARDKPILDLISFLPYEGHPSLWFCYLKSWVVWSNILGHWNVPEVLLFKLAHGLLFLFALYLLLFRFTMPILIRIGVGCSFFFFFEYGIVARGYMLLICLCFGLVVLLKREPIRKGVFNALLFFLLCQTEVYGVFMAVGLFVHCWIDYYQQTNNINFWTDIVMRHYAVALIAGILFFTITVFPEADQQVIGMNIDTSLVKNLGHSFQGNFTNAFWIGLFPDTNVFGYSRIGIIAAIVLIGFLVWFFYRNKTVLFAFVIYMLAAVVFDAYVYQGGVRHWGMNFIFFIAAVELLYKRNQAPDRRRLILLSSFLLCQFYYNYLAIEKEVKYPFSNAKKTASFIREKVPGNVPVVAINKFETAPVGAYAKRELYQLPDGLPFTYYIWLEKVYMPTEEELKLFAQYKKAKGLVIISPKPLGKERYPNTSLWKAFDTYNMKNENYYLYILEVQISGNTN